MVPPDLGVPGLAVLGLLMRFVHLDDTPRPLDIHGILGVLVVDHLILDLMARRVEVRGIGLVREEGLPALLALAYCPLPVLPEALMLRAQPRVAAQDLTAPRTNRKIPQRHSPKP
jgi:hypothetical protein